MKPSMSLREVLGWIAVVGMLLLSAPGVTIVHAEGEEQVLRAASAPGSACEPAAETRRTTREVVSIDISRLVAMQADGGGAGVVGLETGGYGYGEESVAVPGAASGSSAVPPTD
jgi:hypothetical protein